MPATPASRCTTTSVPSSSARTCASRTTGPSDVPPDTIVTTPFTSGTDRATHASRARSSLSRVRRDREQRRARGLVGARDHHAAGAGVEQRGRDRRDLVRRLALGHDPLGRALARLAVGVDAREAEIAEGGHGDGGYPRTTAVRLAASE